MEYAQASWASWGEGDIKQVSGIGRLPNEQRLARLGLTTLQARREKRDMMEVYEIMTGKVDVQPSILFTSTPSREGAAGTRPTLGTSTCL